MRSVFTPSVVGEAARSLNENLASTQKAIDGLLPAVTGGVINRAADDDGITTIYQLLKRTPFDTDPSLGELVETGSHRQKAAESGNGLLRKLYDERVHRLTEETARYSGVSLGAATTLTGLVMSVLMGFLHKQVVSRNLTETQLAALLRDEADVVRGAVPTALAGTLAWFIGTGVSRRVVTPVVPVVPARIDDDRAAGFPWVRWVLIALGLLLLFWLLTWACNRNDDPETTDASVPVVIPADTVASDADGNERVAGADSAGLPVVRVARDLPGGRKLILTNRAFTRDLAQYLATEGSRPNKVFLFDSLTFDLNTARISAQSRPDVNNLVQIMEAYPKLQIRIEGHTDSTGPDAINDPLSGARANAVRDALVNAGIRANRITTLGQGDTEPIATNQTEAGRDRNRRVDVVVTAL